MDIQKELGTFYLSGVMLKEIGEELIKRHKGKGHNYAEKVRVVEVPFLDGKTLGFLIGRKGA